MPKILVSVSGRPMIDHLVALYRDVVDRWIVVVSPADRRDIAAHLAGTGVEVELYEQAEPTGMLDAILIPKEAGARLSDRVWITWCDQIGVDPRTVARMVEAEADEPDLLLPTVPGADPYIHFVRHDGRITDVLHRREGDEMPPTGESDMGLFSLSRRAYGTDLIEYAAEASLGNHTGEKNFLPFIPWLAERGTVRTIRNHEAIEALGVNTPEDLVRMEQHFEAR